MSNGILQITSKPIIQSLSSTHETCSICLGELNSAVDASSYEDLYAYHILEDSQKQTIHHAFHAYCFYRHACVQLIKHHQREISCPLGREVIQKIVIDNAEMEETLVTTIQAQWKTFIDKGAVSLSLLEPSHPSNNSFVLQEHFIAWARRNYTSWQDVFELPPSLLVTFPYKGFWDQFSKENLIQVLKKMPKLLENFPVELSDDEEFVLALLPSGNSRYFPVSDRLKADKGFMLKACLKNCCFLACASLSLKDDRDFIYQVVCNDGKAFPYASLRWKDDKMIALKAIGQCGSLLAEASMRLQNDKDVVFAAIKNDPDALQYMGPLLIDDKGFFEELLPWVPLAIRFASQSLCDDKDLMLKYIGKDARNLHFASDRLKDDQDIILAALAMDPASYWEASARLREDLAILKKYQEKK